MLPSESEKPDAIRGDSVEELFRRHVGWLRDIVKCRFRRASSDDVVQETYLRVARAENSVVLHPKAYLIRIATNVVYDQARRAAARGGRYALNIDDVADDAALQVAADQDAALLLKQLILGLPPLYRNVFILSRFGGLSYEQIAGRHGVSVKTVEYRMSRALALLEAQLRD